MSIDVSTFFIVILLMILFRWLWTIQKGVTQLSEGIQVIGIFVTALGKVLPPEQIKKLEEEMEKDGKESGIDLDQLFK